jgi:hypothetical protein
MNKPLAEAGARAGRVVEIFVTELACLARLLVQDERLLPFLRHELRFGLPNESVIPLRQGSGSDPENEKGQNNGTHSHRGTS